MKDQILNQRGEPVEREERHRFGEFRIPGDARVKFGAIENGGNIERSNHWFPLDYLRARCGEEKGELS